MARWVATGQGNRHWAQSMAGGNGGMEGEHRACLEGGLKRVRQALRLVMGIEDELGHGSLKGHGTDSKRLNVDCTTRNQKSG